MNDQKREYLASMDLKNLRQERKERIDRVRENIKDQNKIIKSIREALSEGGKTVPDLAQALTMGSETVLIYVSTLKKYGIIGEGAKAGDYFTYHLVK